MRPLLNTHHLEMLVTLASTSSLVEAAEQLRVTPSALSHRIREAERRLNITLYSKQGRTLRATPASEILADVAGRLLDEQAQAERSAVAASSGVQHVIRLTIGTYNSFHWLPAFMSFVAERHSDIEIDIAANAVLSPYESLAEHTLDIAITPDTILRGGLKARALFQDELVAIMPPDHPLAARDRLVAEDFVDETYLTYSFRQIPGYEGERFWAPAKTWPLREVRVGSVEAIIELIKAGFGVSILSRWALEPHLDSGSLAMVRLDQHGLPITWNAVYRASARGDEPIQHVVSALQDWFKGSGDGA